MLPSFTAHGLLPPGDYELTLPTLRASFLVVGTGASATWDASWRARLVDGLATLAGQLWSVGVTEIFVDGSFVDGSFVEDKDHPNDIDGYFVCEAAELDGLQDELNKIDEGTWTWDADRRTPYRGYPKKQLPMWHKYRVELYPHYAGLIALRDEFGHAHEFPSAFRRCRRGGQPRGIVKLQQEQNNDPNSPRI